jgi:predicted permease
VSSSALATNTPLDSYVSASFTTIEGAASGSAENDARAYTHVVSSGFLATTGIALLEGEDFATSYAANSEPVAVVSENFARRYWPKTEAVGKRFKFGKADAQAPWLRIIGVCSETKYRGLVANPTQDPDVYISLSQRPARSFVLVIQTIGESRTLGQSVRQIVASIDPNIPVFGLATIEQRIATASANQRFSAHLMTVFAAMALLLASVGLYGMVSFSVGQRTQEIGVRMALGARPVDILRMVFGSTSRLIAIGLVVGAVVAFVLTRFIETMLFDVNAHDPITYLTVAAILAGVALFAAWWPARRAARVDPMTALRSE